MRQVDDEVVVKEPLLVSRRSLGDPWGSLQQSGTLCGRSSVEKRSSPYAGPVFNEVEGEDMFCYNTNSEVDYLDGLNAIRAETIQEWAGTNGTRSPAGVWEKLQLAVDFRYLFKSGVHWKGQRRGLALQRKLQSWDLVPG